MNKYHSLTWHPDLESFEQFIKNWSTEDEKIAFILPYNNRFIIIFEIMDNNYGNSSK